MGARSLVLAPVDRPAEMGEYKIAYFAGIIDAAGIIRVRKAGETELPGVFVHHPNLALLRSLASNTGTKVTTVSRNYHRAPCGEHCTEQHQHIQSVSGRWSVTGAKATVLLAAIQPWLILQREAVQEVLEVGLAAPRKPATATKMAALGWPLPEGWS